MTWRWQSTTWPRPTHPLEIRVSVSYRFSTYIDAGGLGRVTVGGACQCALALFGDSAKNSQQVTPEKLLDAFLGVTAAQHGIRNERQIAHIAQTASRRRPAVEIASQ